LAENELESLSKSRTDTGTGRKAEKKGRRGSKRRRLRTEKIDFTKSRKHHPKGKTWPMGRKNLGTPTVTIGNWRFTKKKNQETFTTTQHKIIGRKLRKHRQENRMHNVRLQMGKNGNRSRFELSQYARGGLALKGKNFKEREHRRRAAPGLSLV